MPRTWTAAFAVAMLAACGSSRPPQAPEPAAPRFRATVRWTQHGVPHVIADDLAGLGFGQGWVSAKQHLCRLADQFVRVRGERARYFGPGEQGEHVDSDFFHLHLGLTERARALGERTSRDGRDVVRGWVAGYNHYVASTPPDQWPEPCRGAAWVRPIDELDLARLDLGLAALASSRLFVEEIANAAPGGTQGRAEWPSPDVGLASNAWGLGADRTESGRGVLVANPHFPWEGDLTFSEIHLTVRGDLDVYGATIPGVPMVAIGFTRHHAWTHTFSSSTRFLIYRLRLTDDLGYARDDATARLVPTTYTIDVRNPDGQDGSSTKQSRTLYRSVHGPMLTSPQMRWAGGAAFAIRDVALDSAGSAADLYLGFARAESFDAFRAALAHRATSWSNTIYADVDGNAWYVDSSAVPALSEEALAAWQMGLKAVPELAAAWKQKIAVVDGSASLFDLPATDPEAPAIVPIEEAPELLRRDFVFNANDSYGWTNPAAPMDDASPLYGSPRALSPRSHANLRMLRERGVAAAAGSDGRFSHTEAAKAILSNRSFTGEQLRDDVLARCQRAVRKQKKLQPLCTRLAEWNLRFGLDSRGAVLWRELMQQLAVDRDVPWKTGFDPANPATPGGLLLDDAAVLAALERAADLLASAGFDVRAGSPPLRDLQKAAIGSRAPVPGGVGLDGVANVVQWAPWNGTLLPRATRQPPVSASGLGPDGYPIDYGTSWVMAVDLEAGGPDADVLMTYADDEQLAMFGRGQLRHALFEDEEIRADPSLVVEEVSSGGTP